MTLFTSQDLSNLTSSQLFEKLDELKAEAVHLGREMAEAEFEHKKVKELLPIFLAQIQALYLAEGKKITESEVFAKSSSDYREKVESANQLGFAYREKEAHFKAVLKSIEAITAISFVRNSELKLARG